MRKRDSILLIHMHTMCYFLGVINIVQQTEQQNTKQDSPIIK